MQESSLRVTLVEFCGAHELDGALCLKLETGGGDYLLITLDEGRRLATILETLVDTAYKENSMPLPHVAFSVDSATGIECAVAITRSLIAGQLDDEAFANPSLTLKNIARVVDWIVGGVMTGSPVPEGAENFKDPQGEQALISLQDALGIQVAGIGGGGVVRQLLLQKLMELAIKFVTEWLERNTGGTS